jgi:2-amino-1-hydroxyethylphosphonate dioxygenase (glycine-forming)
MHAPARERARIALDSLRRHGDRGYIGEPVSQLEHALQAAALARKANAAPEEILAALFHDVGHLIAPQGAAEMDGLGIVEHELIGARWLRELGVSAHVCQLVASHVQAKRYLALRKPGYHDALSDASRGTLRFQGGPMDEAEAREFEAHPLFAAKVRLRVWDEAAKDPNQPAADLDSYADLLASHME